MSMAAASSPCPSCGTDVGAGLLECPSCHRLVHGKELTAIAAAAKLAEDSGNLTAALAAWRKALALLPPATAQVKTINATMKRLSATLDGRAPPSAATSTGTGKKAGALAGAGAVAAAIAKSKALLALVLANGKLLVVGLVKAPTLVSMLGYYYFTSAGRGAGLAAGVIAAIYVHEVGHVAALRRYGIDASAPMFIPGFGALVRMREYPTDVHEEARTGLAGPLWGLFASAVALLIGVLTGSAIALGVAFWSATINAFNLLPVWQLDGSRGFKALSKRERLIVGAVAVAAGLATQEWMPLGVGVVVVGRALVEKTSGPGDRGVLTLFAALAVLHPAIAWVAGALAAAHGS
jgi:Zn-dependent protease